MDICRISKIFNKNQIKISITSSTILINNDEISDDMVDLLLSNLTIISIQNYRADSEDTTIDEETEIEQTETEIEIDKITVFLKAMK